MDNYEDAPAPDPVRVPWQSLSAEALAGVIDDFVLREGTDYGAEYSLAAKRDQVRAQLERGEAQVVFDPARASVDIRLTRDLPGDFFDG